MANRIINPDSIPLPSKNRSYIQLSFVTGFKTNIILFCTFFSLILKSKIERVKNVI